MKRYPVIAFSFCLVVAAVPTPAQTTFASITGTVADARGAPGAGAATTAVHRDSNYRYTATSNAPGAYTFAQLREGVYTIRTQVDGFKEFVVTDVQLVSLDVRGID